MMSRTRVAGPIHVGQIGGHPVRFFRSPEDGPRLPWHSQDDLFVCLGMPAVLQEDFRRKAANHPEWGGVIHTVATPDGITRIAPHFMAQSLVEAMVECGVAGNGVIREHIDASMGAMSALTAGMSPTDAMYYTMAAAKAELEEPAPRGVA
jgi:hypothetical protein